MTRFWSAALAALLYFAALPAQAGNVTTTCGVFSQYLGGLGSAYNKPVTQCSGTLAVTNKLSVSAFVSRAFEDKWMGTSGDEIDFSGAYSFSLGEIKMTASAGIFIIPGDDIAFATLRGEKSYKFQNGMTLTPFVQLEHDETLGDAFPSASYIEPGLDLAFPLYNKWSLDASSRLRFVNDGSKGVIASTGITHAFTEQLSVRAGVEARGEFGDWDPEIAASVSITKSW